MSIRVIVVDDQDLVRAGFVALINADPDLEAVGEAGDGAEAVRLVRRLVPDVVLMDVRMPGLDGIEATRRIVGDPMCSGVRIVVLTTFALDEYVLEALRAGAAGFLLKDTPPPELLRAVRLAANGESVLSPSVTRALVEAFVAVDPPRNSTPLVDLTAREADILALLSNGLSNTEIAERLHLGVSTVKTYVSRLLDKLQVTTRTQLVIRAYESGFVEPGRN